MENLLGNMYCWFESFFGQNLGDHLWGFDGVNYTLPIKFNTIGLIGLSVSLVTVLCYYYVINHPRFNKWWSWTIMLLINGIINLFIGYAMSVSDFLDGNIADVLMYTRDENNEIVDTLISVSDCWGFGIANFFIATIFFIAFTFVFKWGSRNAKYSPF